MGHDSHVLLLNFIILKNLVSFFNDANSAIECKFFALNKSSEIFTPVGVVGSNDFTTAQLSLVILCMGLIL